MGVASYGQGGATAPPPKKILHMLIYTVSTSNSEKVQIISENVIFISEKN